MLGGSASVKAAQMLIPGASENGVIAQVVPGAGALQNTMLSSLGRIEAQTQRVSELLEDNARRDQQARDAEERARRSNANELKARIREGGYSLDEAGYLAAVRDGFRYISDFDQLGIKLSESGLRNFLVRLEAHKEKLYIYRFGQFLAGRQDTSAPVRKVVADLGSDGKKMKAAFKVKGARATVCDTAAYRVPVSTEALAAACKLDGAPFAKAYAKYFNDTFAWLMYETFIDRRPDLPYYTYLANAVEELPLKKVGGPLILSKLPSCAYYEGEVTFDVAEYQNSVGDWLIGGRSSPPGDYFSVLDDEAWEGGVKDLCRGTGRQASPVCRGRVIVVRECAEQPDNIVVRVLSIDKPVVRTFGDQASR
jgi:hypothetical protein